MWPLDITKYRITARFNDRNPSLWGNDIHGAIDIAAPEGTPFVAVDDGLVIQSETLKDGANTIQVKHNDGSYTVYHHNKQNLVKVGDRVKRGQIIGLVGKTGKATGSHLHFATLPSPGWPNRIDPEIYMQKFNRTTTMSTNTVTVQAGWGLSHVANAAGLPPTEETFISIYNLNQRHRGSWDWRSLNTRMGAGDVLIVRKDSPISPVIPATDIAVQLKTEIESLKASASSELAKRDENIKNLESRLELAEKADAEKEKSLQDALNALKKEIDDAKVIIAPEAVKTSENGVKSVVLEDITFTPAQYRGMEYLWSEFTKWFSIQWRKISKNMRIFLTIVLMVIANVGNLYLAANTLPDLITPYMTISSAFLNSTIIRIFQWVTNTGDKYLVEELTYESERV